jgi:hypothetical protein
MASRALGSVSPWGQANNKCRKHNALLAFFDKRSSSSFKAASVKPFSRISENKKSLFGSNCFEVYQLIALA